jgi:hypothetical protein
MSPTDKGRRRSERGQAATETILISWIMVMFFAVMYQLFLVNHTIYRSVAAVHQQLFEQGFRHNCLTDPDGGVADILSELFDVLRRNPEKIFEELEKIIKSGGVLPGPGNNCRYQTNPHTHAYVVWRKEDIPEIQVPVVGLMRRFGLSDPLLIESNLKRGECPTCKTTQMGAGPQGAGGHIAGLSRFFSKALWAVGNAFTFISSQSQRLNG